MHYYEAEIDIPPKIMLQSEFFLWYPFSVALYLQTFKKYAQLSVYQLWNSARIIKKIKMYVTNYSSKFHGHMFISSKVISVL